MLKEIIVGLALIFVALFLLNLLFFLLPIIFFVGLAYAIGWIFLKNGRGVKQK